MLKPLTIENNVKRDKCISDLYSLLEKALDRRFHLRLRHLDAGYTFPRDYLSESEMCELNGLLDMEKNNGMLDEKDLRTVLFWVFDDEYTDWNEVATIGEATTDYWRNLNEEYLWNEAEAAWLEPPSVS